MSTKIYNGFIFNTSDWNLIHKTIMDFRKQLKPLVKQGIAKAVAELATLYVDNLTFDLKKCKKVESPYWHANKVLQNRIQKVSNPPCPRDPLIDYTCNISILPNNKDKILGIIYAEQSNFLDIWFKLPIVENYAYWDNCDPPKNVTDTEWKQREEDWDKALKDFGSIPAMNGFTAEIVNKYQLFFINIDIALKYIPSYESRASFIATELLYREEKKKDVNLAFFSWIKNEGKEEFQNKVELVKPKLISIDRDLLINDFPKEYF